MGVYKNSGKIGDVVNGWSQARKNNELLQEYIYTLDLDAWVTELLHLIQRAHVASSNR